MTKRTDANGLFELTGAVGRNLAVDIHKPGYYFSRRQNNTIFGCSPEEGNFQADRASPVIFRLRKKGPGVELVTSQFGMSPHFGFHPPDDGTAVMLDFFNRKTGGLGQMQVSKLTPPRSPDGVPRPKEWRLTLTIPDGGFIKAEEKEFLFYPPKTGYQSMLDFHYPADREGWTDHIEGQYYITFGNPRRYGRIKVEAWSVGGIRLQYAINPDGRPYLEPKENPN